MTYLHREPAGDDQGQAEQHPLNARRRGGWMRDPAGDHAGNQPGTGQPGGPDPDSHGGIRTPFAPLVAAGLRRLPRYPHAPNQIAPSIGLP